jgi:hypothetical protein
MLFNRVIETKNLRFNVGIQTFDNQTHSISSDYYSEVNEILNQSMKYLHELLVNWEQHKNEKTSL